jgi:exosortase/archaeosortase family protein
MAATTPLPKSTGRPSIPAAARAVRLVIALVLVAGVTAIAFGHQEVRHLEAVIADLWIDKVAPQGSMIWGDSFLLHLSETKIIAFRITAECTIAILAAPILAFSAAMIGFTRVRAWRWLVALLAGLGLIVLVNQLRLGLIAWATLNYGLDVGYEISHTLVGSIMAIVGFAASILMMLVIMTGKRRRGRAKEGRTKAGRANAERPTGRGRRAAR